MQTSGVFGALSDQVKKTIIDFTALGMTELEARHKALFNENSTTSKFVRKQSIAPFGDMPAKGEGAEYSFDVIQPGYSKDLTPVEYGFGFQWTETSQEDDEYDVLAQHSKWLGFSARVLQETKGAYVFNNAFGAVNTADGQDLCSTTHALKRGGTAKNRLSTDSDLSVATLQTMLADMMTNTKLESGQKVRPARDLHLLVHPVNLGLAHRICKASGLPQSADNDPNPINAYGTVSPLAWEYLDDEDAWFLVAKKSSMHGLFKISRVKPKVGARQTAWQTGNLIVTIRMREVFDAFDWRNIAGTPGA